jgi:hypothetical protein
VDEIPNIIKQYSKEVSSTERAELAREILKKRKEYRSLLEQKAEHESAVDEFGREETGVQERIDEKSGAFLGKARNVFSLRRDKGELKGVQTQKEIAQKEIDRLTEALYELDCSFDTSEKRGTDIPEVYSLLRSFYRKEQQKWQNAQYNKEDIQRYFDPEYLATLSIEDYEELMIRFPSHMVTHVTRQGIRDHTRHIFHTAGVGEHTNGFEEIVSDGILRSPLSVYLKDGLTREAIEKILHLDDMGTKEEALKRLDTITGDAQLDGSYADKNSVHFACEDVADAYYGSETGNEIFIVFPSALIASQYYFQGEICEEGGGYWNDKWVWDKDGKGMDINAGIVFIPAEAKVDPKTGSRYQVENGAAIVNKDHVQQMNDFFEATQFIDTSQKIMKAIQEASQQEPLEQRKRDRIIQENLEPFRTMLVSDFGIEDKRVQDAILDYTTLNDIRIHKDSEDYKTTKESTITVKLKKQGVYFREAKETVSSQKYWEKYFHTHSDKKPSKIVYYQGANPTKALSAWIPRFNKSEDPNIGFPERRIVGSSSAIATKGMENFESLAKEVIDEYYSDISSEAIAT